MSCHQLESSLGFSVTKKSNIDLIDDGKLLFIAGNTLQILNINTAQNRYGKFNEDHLIIHGHADGIGAFAIHPNKECFAFGEIGHIPDVHIYSYPQLKAQKTLSNGTQRRYSDMQFNVDGSYLATIGGAPDHMLTIWDWKIGSVILRAKAFSQEVFKVRFSPYNQNRLITSGTGHIRFWEMAETFTGLKLQGKIGKFGEVDLSDIWSFVELPSGKILSGSEDGNLLMWQQDLIQFVVRPDGHRQCHRSNIIYVDLYVDDNAVSTLVSAASDGTIRFWDCDDIEFFEPSDEQSFYPLTLRDEIKVDAQCQLMSITKFQSAYWIIQDAMGSVYRMEMDGDHTLKSVLSFHGRFVTAIECGPESHDMITAGKDGTIRRWDLQRQQSRTMKRLQSPINMLLPLRAEDGEVKHRYFMAFCDDGVVRILQNLPAALTIAYSLRLHDEAILFGAISTDGAFVATVTEQQLFFSKIKVSEDGSRRIEPIGFVLLKHSLKRMYWSDDNKMLFSFSGHEVICYRTPIDDQVDSSSSFEIELEPMIVTFTPFLTEEDSKEDEPEDTTNPETAENEDDDDTESVDKDKEKGDKKEDEVAVKSEKVNVFDTIDWEISCILPCSEQDADLWIAVHCPDHDSFTIPSFFSWKLEENQIVQFNPTHLGQDHIHHLSYSQSKQFLLVTTRQSMVQVRDVLDAEHFVNIRIHSSWQQHTRNVVAMTFDDRMLVTSSADGSLFCHLFDPDKLKHPSFDVHFDLDYISIDEVDCTPKGVVVQEAADMTQNDYSVQGEKIQRELDNAKSAAEAYKAQLRAELEGIRSKKIQILDKSKEFMRHDLGLSINDLDIDQNLRTKMSDKLENDKAQIRREMAWNAERIKVGLSKLENAFLKTVTVENIEVSSFRTNHVVSTFRTPLLPDWVQRDIAKVHQIINAESEKARQIASKENGPGHNTTTNSTSTFENAQKHLGDTNNLSSSTLTTQITATSKRDGDATMDGELRSTATTPMNTVSASKQKKMVREKLKNALEDLQHEKPDENTDDPRDIEAIKRAKKEIGDYKLKSDPKYVVPEDEHVNASQKRKQMILLLESVNYIKMGLNDRVLALRDLKKRIVENMATDTQRLNEIAAELDRGDDLLEAPTIDEEREWPQHRYKYSTDDLVEFEAILQQELDEQSGAGNAFGGGGGGGHGNDGATGSGDADGGGDGAGNGDEDDVDGAAAAMSSGGGKGRSGVSAVSMTSGGGDGGSGGGVDAAELMQRERAYLGRLSGVRVSELEQDQRALRSKQVEYEKAVLMEKMDSTMHSFDAAVSELREEKCKLLNDLKLTELKLLTLLKELSVLSEFEDREISLNGKLLKCRTEKAQVVVDLTECQERLSAKLEEIHLWQEKDRKIMKEFDNIVGERNQFYDDLKRIFKRKIKRHKRGHGGAGRRKDGDVDGGGDGGGSLSESSSSSESWSDGDGADSWRSDGGGDGDGGGDRKNEDDSCPKDCDNLIYEKVMELREKRLDQEEILVEFEKAVEELKEQNLWLINKEKNIDNNLSSTEQEIEHFQTEKQQVLNQIVVTVPLLASQIRIDSDSGSLPADIGNVLIFELKSLDNLQCRIQQQKQEKTELKKDYVELRKLHKSQSKKINAKQSNIDVEKRKCEQVQFLKYGRLVPLEVLDLNNQGNQEAVQLAAKMEKMSVDYKAKLRVWDRKVMRSRNQLQALIAANTQCIETVTALRTRQNALSSELSQILDVDVIKDSAPSDQKRNRELQKLVEVAKTQANEIDVLKAEIHMLQRKGGMLYAVPEI